jgi:transcriptional regulator with XRE-family HTH domain
MKSDRELYLQSFATNLRTLRKAKGYTQERLAYEATLSYKYLQELEGSKKCPSLIIVIRLCIALDVSLDEIVEDLSKLRKDTKEQLSA